MSNASETTLSKIAADSPVLVGVNTNSLYKRVYKALKKEGKALRISRPYQRDRLGHYYIVDKRGLLGHHVNLETYARAHGLLAAWECHEL